jgi:hypothetical protein
MPDQSLQSRVVEKANPRVRVQNLVVLDRVNRRSYESATERNVPTNVFGLPTIVFNQTDPKCELVTFGTGNPSAIGISTKPIVSTCPESDCIAYSRDQTKLIARNRCTARRSSSLCERRRREERKRKCGENRCD